MKTEELLHPELVADVIKEQIKFAENYISVMEDNPRIVGTDVPESKVRLEKLKQILKQLV